MKNNNIRKKYKNLVGAIGLSAAMATSPVTTLASEISEPVTISQDSEQTISTEEVRGTVEVVETPAMASESTKNTEEPVKYIPSDPVTTERDYENLTKDQAETIKKEFEVNEENRTVTVEISKTGEKVVSEETVEENKTFQTEEDAIKYAEELINQGYEVEDVKVNTTTTTTDAEELNQTFDTEEEAQNAYNKYESEYVEVIGEITEIKKEDTVTIDNETYTNLTEEEAETKKQELEKDTKEETIIVNIYKTGEVKVGEEEINIEKEFKTKEEAELMCNPNSDEFYKHIKFEYSSEL